MPANTIVSSVDVVLFRVHNEKLQVLLMQRTNQNDVYHLQWSLIGGTVQNDDLSLDMAAHRTLMRRTKTDVPYLEQVGSVGSPVRDPRGWSQTTVYFALLMQDQHIEEQPDLRWFDIDNPQLKGLAFDHVQLFQNALTRLQNKVAYSLLPAFLIGKTFTISQLHKMYEILLDREVPESKLRDQLKKSPSLKKESKQIGVAHRPSDYYSIRKDADLFFPVPLVKA